MNLQTDRLYLREFIDSDMHNLYKLDNNPDVIKYISSYTGKETTLKDCLATVKSQQMYYSINEGMGLWPVSLKKNDEFIGWAALKYLGATDIVEVGYRLLPEYWNKGYATEITKALITYGFSHLNFKTICAVAMPDNKSSIRVLEKSGIHFIRFDRFYNCKVAFYEIKNNTP